MAKYQINGDRIIDLSQTIEPNIPRPVGFPEPEMHLFKELNKDNSVVNVETWTFCPHAAGTHIDAPYHFIEGTATIDEMDPAVIIGSAVVVDMRHKKNKDFGIERSDVEEWERSTGETIREGDAVLFMTDFSRFWGLGEQAQKDFLDQPWPYITRSVADYLLEKKVRLVGVESMDLDFIDPYDLTKAEFIGHRTFLGNGIYIIENLKNLDKIGKTRCDIVATPLKLKGGTGSPVRVLAIV